MSLIFVVHSTLFTSTHVIPLGNEVRISLADTPTTLMAIFITDDVYDKLTF